MYQIFVVEDEILIRQNIRNMIEKMEGPYAFCGEAADGEMALSMMQDLMPDILLTDIRMPFLDGFELISHAKAMMPWLKTLIISGYDEFESAQRAISLGVDRYLLKPVRPEELTAAIHTVARQLEQSKNTHNELLAGYDKNQLRHALRQHFMQHLFFGGSGTSSLLERARGLDIDIVQPFYQVVLFHFDGGQHEASGTANWGRRVAELLGDDRAVLPYFAGYDELTLLVFTKNKESLTEKTYRTINIIRHELQQGDTVISAVVGNIVERLSAVKDAYGAANTMMKKIRGMRAGQIIDINDTAQITIDIVSFSSAFSEQYRQTLLYAAVEDVPALLEGFLHGPGSDAFNSTLYRYYTLIDVLKTAVHIVCAARQDVDPKDITAQFSGSYDIFGASAQRGAFEACVLALLQEAVRMKQENAGFFKSRHVISKAEHYIAENYCDPNISLISVAQHVGLSAAHLSTVFSQALGKTFISHVTALRMEKAKELLLKTDWKLSAIAVEIGYSEPNYFSHVFKKSEGITPKDFRSNNL